MEPTAPATDEELEEAFQEGAEWGITVVHEKCQTYLLRYIRSIGLGLSWEECDSVYADVLVELHQAATKPEFDQKAPLRLAQTIACRRAIDARRKKGYHARHVKQDEFLDQWAKDSQSTNLGLEARLQDPLVWREFSDALREIIEELPEMQRATAFCFQDVYLELRRRDMYQPLAKAVGDVLKRSVTTVQVKSAWKAAKEKIREELIRRKFSFMKDE